MRKAAGEIRQFSGVALRAIREYISGVSDMNLTVQSVESPTGVRGFAADGSATGNGHEVRFTATRAGADFRVDLRGAVSP